ncbi:ESX secretion-associated protein EspG [Lentzea sp. NBRC 105346]|uniref:ESX secretion-associated protein EspG n=1 Tax=Lentzea sp. NBRC 105346 TaxID=3032205 RepID=UPI0024A4BAC8|nr:ESX secretion-associated protein EspG [Lentzea sp. NBRC 105346]GLZ32506.1 ESX secretion-associated protein EspG [Lentzea sp. NBRC 105346]
MNDTERGFKLSSREFFLLWQAVHGEEREVPLGTPHVGRTRAARQRLTEETSNELYRRGLGTIGRPDPDLRALVSGLAEFERALEVVYFKGTEMARALATAGWSGTFAARVGDDVHLRSFRSTALASSTVAALPALRPGNGRAVNIRWDDYVRAGEAGERDGESGFMEVLRHAGIREPEAYTLLRAVTSRIGGGQLALTARNRDGIPRPTGRSVSWLDTREGRYLVRQKDGWLVLAPTDQARLTGAVDELLSTN